MLGGIGVFVVPFNLCVELVGNKYKTPIGLIFHAPYSIGQAILGLIAMWIRDYQTYQIVISIPGFLLLGLYFIIPESPRWLIAKKRYSEAAKVIKCAQTYNKVSELLLETSNICFILKYIMPDYITTEII
jgi:OCT family organic cation transporter-like MFS transporter 4/5